MKTTDLIKEKLNILDVVGSYVTLERAGKTYKGKSPFTNEKTASFFVSPDKGFFYCFSSGKGGDIFTFIEEIERVEFKDALKILADRAGVDLGTITLEDQGIEKKRFAILDAATRWYEVHLRKNTDVVNYLLGRGLSKDTMVAFRLGFAPDAWREAATYLTTKKGYSTEDLASVGLVIEKEGSAAYDRFRSRIMFPLFDGRGRVVGFSGRIFGKDDETAKYINSPEGPLFDKSKVLYGYHTAKAAMGKAGFCILVEGQLDVLMAQQAGYVNTVAISGTGLTDDHVTMVKRFTDTIVLALDADKAGIKATRRSVLSAYRGGMQVKVVRMPDGTDPADLINKSREQWDLAVSDAKDYVDYRLELLADTDGFDERRTAIIEDVFPFILHTKSAMVQDRILQKVARFLGVSVESVRDDFGSFNPNPDDLIVPRELGEVNDGKNSSGLSLNPKDEILFTLSYLRDRGEDLDPAWHDDLSKRYTETFDTSIDDDMAALDQTSTNVNLFVLENRYQDTSSTQLMRTLDRSLIEESINRLKGESNTLLESIRQAEASGDQAKVADLQSKHQQLLLEQNRLRDILSTT